MLEYIFGDIVKIKTNNKELKYTIILPGVQKSDINVTISNTKLSVETKENTAFGEKFIYNDEYNYSKKYLVEQATSTLVDGVLTITIPAREIEKEKVRQITID